MKLLTALCFPYVFARGVFPVFGYPLVVNSVVYRFAWVGCLSFSMVIGKRLIGVGLSVWTFAATGCGISIDFWSITIYRMKDKWSLGKSEPHIEVMSPVSKGVQMYNMNTLLVFMYREFHALQKRVLTSAIRANEFIAVSSFFMADVISKKLLLFFGLTLVVPPVVYPLETGSLTSGRRLLKHSQPPKTTMATTIATTHVEFHAAAHEVPSGPNP
ncbi:unnamed protein product [Lactuca saligna]|uniref:E3 ubiquitin-protein ligase MARCHF6-like C-terminal domain-containing protein n=1 Tax=Lactuca saligna TaxID=75948 RepID=A0AA35ZTP9_LACSI|nr:unnamed protein product [Lactuca saligna]